MGWVQTWPESDVDRAFSRVPGFTKNDPHLFRSTKVKVLRAFRVRGQPVDLGSIVAIAYHLAIDLQHLGKCEILEIEELPHADS